MIGIGIGIPLTRTTSSGPTLGTTMATTHYNRVIADGGVLPAGISGLGSVLDSVISAYGVTSSADFNTKVPVFLDPQYTGYKLGAGAGTTAGQAARTVYAINSSADVTQTTAASQPLLLAHSGVNYWWGSGVAGNYCSSPITISSPYSNDFEIQVNVQNSDISGGYYYQTVFSVGENGSLGLGFYNNNIFIWQNGGFGGITTVGIGSSIDGYYKVTKESVNYSFYSSNDGINWTLIERVIGANIYTFTGTNMCVGGYANATDLRGNYRGKIRRIKLWIDGLSNTGTLSFDFNPMEYSASSSQTAWNSSTGEVWTINVDSAASGFVGRLVNRTIMAFGGDASTTNLSPNTSIQVNQPDTVYAAFKFDVFNIYQGVYDSNTASTRQVMDNVALGGYLEISAGVAGLNLSGLSQYTLKLATALFNGASSSLQVNNGTATTGNAGTQKMNGLRIGVLANSPPSYTLKGIVNTILVSAANDGTATKTALYNTIKSMNNNAF